MKKTVKKSMPKAQLGSIIKGASAAARGTSKVVRPKRAEAVSSFLKGDVKADKAISKIKAGAKELKRRNIAIDNTKGSINAGAKAMIGTTAGITALALPDYLKEKKAANKKKVQANAAKVAANKKKVATNAAKYKKAYGGVIKSKKK
jgi:hypothetical protein